MRDFYVIIARRTSVFISAFDTEEEAKHFMTPEDIKKGDIVEKSSDYDFSDKEWNELIEYDYRKKEKNEEAKYFMTVEEVNAEWNKLVENWKEGKNNG